MYRSTAASALTAITLLLGACGGSEARPSPAPTARTEAYVVRSGFSIRDGRVGVGALVRVRGDRAVHTITLGISLFAKGRRVGRQEDTLPYCPASTDCWWGQAFSIEHPVDRLRVQVVGTSGRTVSPPPIRKLRVVVQDDAVLVTPPGEDGTAYLVALHGVEPSFGISFFMRRDETAELRYGKDDFPRGTNDRVLGVFYPGRVPAGVSGPAD